jgi:outer membrane protein OmpA-like peptidoglycan-associated protein
MKRVLTAIAALALLGVASGAALGQGRGQGGGGPGAGGGYGGGGQGWSGGGRQGGGGQGSGGQWSGGGRQGGGGQWSGGGRQWAGGGGQWSGGSRGYQGGYGGGYRGAYRGGYSGYRGGWYGGGYGYRGGYGGYGYRGWYGGWYPGVSLYFGWPWYGYPYYYGYPAYSAYPAYPPYYAYPAYVDPGPVVYIEKPPVVAAAPPPPAPAPRAEAPKVERYTLSAKELFDFDRTNLRMPQPKLDEIADALIRNPQITRVRITGYTDRLGTDSYNLQLSQRRADTVKAYLVSKGVAANRLEAIGRGEANPVVECHDRTEAVLIACLEPNRRVEIEPFTIERPYG